jgi:hypothetical protein
MKHISPDDRQIILKMIERFEQGNNDWSFFYWREVRIWEVQ